MASHAYLRALAAPSVAPLAGMQPSARVKLVFADELAAFVLRQRGYSSCWYLVSRTARLVGDLMHEIAEEFELLERCPRGIEMVLDSFHVLANQPIEMVRDNDMLVVQCPLFVAETRISKDETKRKTKRSASTETAETDAKRSAKKLKTMSQAESGGKVKKSSKKKVTAPPPESSSSSSEDSCDDSSDDDDEKTAKPTSAVKKWTQKAAVAASSASESNSDESSSSEDDEATPQTPKKRAFKAIVKDTVRKMNETIVTVQSSSSSSSTSSSSDSSSDSSDSDSDVAVASAPVKKASAKTVQATVSKGKQPAKEGAEAAKGTRRRRRPRRRPKGDEAGAPSTAVNPGKPKATTSAVVTKAPVAQPIETPKEIRPLRIRGVPPSSKQGGKLHMRFDGPNKGVVLPPPAPAREVSSDLQKYGPAPVKPTKKPSHVNEEQPEKTASNTKKKPVKEMWKRPYEIISSIHDETPTGSAAATTNAKPTLDALLVSFPSKPSETSSLPTPSGLQAGDTIAYKTLTLCMETWQPIVSEWKCGKVLSLQDKDTAVALQPHNWILPPTTDGELAWEVSSPPLNEETEVSVSSSELSELRYLAGPTKTHITTP